MTCCADDSCVLKYLGDCDPTVCQNWCRSIFADGTGTCLPDGNLRHPRNICNCVHKCSI
ncbi:LCR [Medicago truncatula]|uniref:LCR n=1 Tax=Medicago truncatula TaxID=3880 RepID=A0A072V708_MEDTR|nr:LCR [Medicago truncatula]